MIRGFVEQHAMEAAFLWTMREHAVDAPHFDLLALARHDERLDAHLDGLRVAHRVGQAVARRALVVRRTAGEMFTAAVLGFGTGATADRDAVAEMLEQAPQLLGAMASALAWLPFRQARGVIEWLEASRSPLARRVALAAYGLHREDPGDALEAALGDRKDRDLRVRAIRVAGETGRQDAVPAVRAQLRARDGDTRYWAAWSLAQLGDSSGLEALKRAAAAGGPNASRSVAAVLGVLDRESCASWIRDLWKRQSTARCAIDAVRFDGDPVWVPDLLDAMQSSPLARAAGEAFATITGRVIDDEYRVAPRAADVDTVLDQHRGDRNPDLDLPWPAADALREWWHANEAAFTPGRALLLGRPRNSDWLLEVLRAGRQRERALAATLFARLGRGRRAAARRVFDVRAPGFRQLALLERFNESTRARGRIEGP